MTRSRTARVGALVVAAASALGACGDDGGKPPTADITREVRNACGDLQDVVGALTYPLVVDDASQFGRTVTDAFEEAGKAIDGLAPPEEQQGAYDDLMSALTRAADTADEMRKAADDGDGGKVFSLEGDLRAALVAVNTVAGDFNLDECVSLSETGPPTTPPSTDETTPPTDETPPPTDETPPPTDETTPTTEPLIFDLTTFFTAPDGYMWAPPTQSVVDTLANGFKADADIEPVLVSVGGAFLQPTGTTDNFAEVYFVKTTDAILAGDAAETAVLKAFSTYGQPVAVDAAGLHGYRFAALNATRGFLAFTDTGILVVVTKADADTDTILQGLVDANA